MSPERIESTSDLGIEGPAPVSTAHVGQGQSATSGGERSSGGRKGRGDRLRRPIPPADETSAELSELGGAEQDREPESERQQDPDQDDYRVPHRIDGLA